jgi:hypothetical protein
MDEVIKRIRNDAIDRILDAVGREHIPEQLDRDQLAAGLKECWYTYLEVVDRNSDRPIRDKLRRLKSLRAAAKRFRPHLTPDEFWGGDFQSGEFLEKLIGWLIAWLDAQIGMLNNKLKFGPDFSEALRLKVDPREYADRWKSRSPLEWIAGHYLPELFEKHFGLSRKFYRRSEDNNPDGPMIRFVERALIELEITNRGRAYARETIAKAISDMRTHRVRKKPRQ